MQTEWDRGRLKAMADEKSGPLFRAFRKIWEQITKDIVSATSGGIMALLGVVRLLAWSHLSELGKGVIWGAAATIVLVPFLSFLIKYWRSSDARRQRAHTAPAVWQLREVYHSHLKPCVQLAYQILYIDLCSPLLPRPPADSEGRFKWCIVELVRSHVNKNKNENLENSLEDKSYTVAEFRELKQGLFESALQEYIEIIATIRLVGPLLVGAEQLEASSNYKNLLQRHKGCVEKLYGLRNHPDTRDIDFTCLEIIKTDFDFYSAP
jgi:hypothetical protein